MNEIAEAVKILRAGGLVAFPTETVYGLGADATNPAAVRRIFAAKGRPATNPLIAHVADEAAARKYAAAWPAAATDLARRFWPGPLTLVLPKSADIAAEATAGRPTVALRSPDHPLALQLLRMFDGPLAAPSANRSNRVSPTTAAHVREEMGDSVDLILDGGPCRVGIESTVLDLSGAPATILRPGSITRQQIEEVIGPVQRFEGSVSEGVSAASPGQHILHYAPRLPALRFTRDELKKIRPWMERAGSRKVALVWMGEERPEVGPACWEAGLPASAVEYAQRLYAALREADRSGAELILVQMPPDAPQWSAIRDRLVRATQALK